MKLWHLHGVMFRTKIAIICLILCICVLFLLRECNVPFKSIKNVLLANLNSTCKVNERCVYDTFSTLHMVDDDEIVVAIDGVTGKTWKLGHVRRDHNSETWLQNNTLAPDKLKSRYPSLVLEPNEKYVQPSSKNRTNGRYLIFNRVPKCASSMFIDLITDLMKKANNHFRFYSWKYFWERQLTIEQEQEFLHGLAVNENEKDQNKLPVAMERHFYFLDSKHYNIQKGN